MPMNGTCVMMPLSLSKISQIRSEDLSYQNLMELESGPYESHRLILTSLCTMCYSGIAVGLKLLNRLRCEAVGRVVMLYVLFENTSSVDRRAWGGELEWRRAAGGRATGWVPLVPPHETKDFKVIDCLYVLQLVFAANVLLQMKSPLSRRDFSDYFSAIGSSHQRRCTTPAASSKTEG